MNLNILGTSYKLNHIVIFVMSLFRLVKCLQSLFMLQQVPEFPFFLRLNGIYTQWNVCVCVYVYVCIYIYIYIYVSYCLSIHPSVDTRAASAF